MRMEDECCGQGEYDHYLRKATILEKHLQRVLKETRKFLHDVEKKPRITGQIEHRLFWVIRGVDPSKAICRRHGKKITQNNWGELICNDCMDESVTKNIRVDENEWYDPDDKPPLRIYGIRYGIDEDLLHEVRKSMPDEYEEYIQMLGYCNYP